MFLHNFIYAFKSLFKRKTPFIWNLLFPIGLATFMFMAFGNLYEKDEVFHAIPVAVVLENENQSLEMTIDALSSEGDQQMLDAKYMSEAKAKNALRDKKVTGIIYVDEKPSLTVAESCFNATVLKMILQQYQDTVAVVSDVAKINPDKVAQATLNLTTDINTYVESATTEGNQSPYVSYFYAVFAMSCLFASFVSLENVENLQPYISSLGMRRSMSPCSRALTVFAEFVALVIFQFIIQCVSLCYLILLGVDFGNKYLGILGILFFGSCIGVAMGAIIGAIPKIGNGARSGIATGISMLLAVMADLCVYGIKDSIEHTAPIINRINPAALISDSFYALNTYDDYSRYWGNIVNLLVITMVLLVSSFIILRRNKYASL